MKKLEIIYDKYNNQLLIISDKDIEYIEIYGDFLPNKVEELIVKILGI